MLGQQPPNIVIYVLDSLRADHLGCYGYQRPTSPHIDGLAAAGVLFRKAFAQATWTRPSAGSLWTGCYPAVHGALNMGRQLRGDVPSLARSLRAAGYQTGAFISIGQLSSNWGFAEGFETYQELWRQTDRSELVQPETQSHELVRDVEVVAAFRSWLGGQRRNAPFFALLWGMGTHMPYQIPAAGERVFARQELAEHLDTVRAIWAIDGPEAAAAVRDRYDEAIRLADRSLGELITFLHEQSVYDNTAVLVLGDHGEIFNEHGRGSHWRGSSLLSQLGSVPIIGQVLRRYRLVNRWGVAGHLDVMPYEEVLHIPLVARFPAGHWAGQQSDALVEVVDIAPTVLDLAGVGAAGENMQGSSLLSVVDGASAGKACVFSDSQRVDAAPRYVSIRDALWKAVRIAPVVENSEGTGKQGTVERVYRRIERRLSPRTVLYRMPDESRDLCGENTDQLERLSAILDGWQEANNERAQGLEDRVLEADELAESRLRALGYLE